MGHSAPRCFHVDLGSSGIDACFQVNDAFSVEKGDTGFAFTTKDRINADEVRYERLTCLLVFEMRGQSNLRACCY